MWRATWRQRLMSIFVIRNHPTRQIADAIACWAMHGNAVATRTPTSILSRNSQKALIYRALVKLDSAPSRVSSTNDLERPCNTKRQHRNLKHVLQRSVETTAQSESSSIAFYAQKADFSPATIVKQMLPRRLTSKEVKPGSHNTGQAT